MHSTVTDTFASQPLSQDLRWTAQHICPSLAKRCPLFSSRHSSSRQAQDLCLARFPGLRVSRRFACSRFPPIREGQPHTPKSKTRPAAQLDQRSNAGQAQLQGPSPSQAAVPAARHQRGLRLARPTQQLARVSTPAFREQPLRLPARNCPRTSQASPHAVCCGLRPASFGPEGSRKAATAVAVLRPPTARYSCRSLRPARFGRRAAAASSRA